MQGTILTFQKETNSGLISGYDGKRYTYTRLGWANTNVEPKEGAQVDFVADEQNVAAEIILLKSPKAGEKTKIAAFLFAFFFGVLGVHKFYLGQTGWGIVYIILTLTVFGLIITAPLAFIEAIILITMSDEKFDQKYNS